MNDDQKVSILLAEYNTLRAEVLAARSYVSQATGVTAAVIMGTVAFAASSSFSGPSWVPWLIAALAILYLTGTVVWNEVNTQRFTARLRALELKINTRAGERLLVWETESGWGTFAVPKRKR